MRFSCLFRIDPDGQVAAAVFGNALKLHAGIESAVPVDEYLLLADFAGAALVFENIALFG